jgi:plastocyanin
MKHKMVVGILTAFSLALPMASRADAATIDARITAPGGAAIQDAVVYALPVAKAVLVGHKVATMDQKNRMFTPHVLPIQTGTWVEFPNSDDIRHQVYSTSPAKKFQLPLYKGKPAFPVQFNTAGTVVLGCNIHDWMSAYVVVVDTPYFARAENGRASIPDVEPGQYTVRVWYPEMTEEPLPVSLTVGASDHPSLSFVKP